MLCKCTRLSENTVTGLWSDANNVQTGTKSDPAGMFNFMKLLIHNHETIINSKNQYISVFTAHIYLPV